uniref:Uncharacterized protein n=1 Tax=viral metagenome TaxID=1070528 RepID=A0A6C0BV94_9ZZZZ
MNDQYIHNDYDWLIDEQSMDPGTPKVKKEKNTEWTENDWIETDWVNGDWQNGDWHETEYRPDPYDFKLYTREEFYQYYGRYLEWNLQDPQLMWRRKNIDDMIIRYKNILDPKNINHLIDKFIETFV